MPSFTLRGIEDFVRESVPRALGCCPDDLRFRGSSIIKPPQEGEQGMAGFPLRLMPEFVGALQQWDVRRCSNRPAG